MKLNLGSSDDLRNGYLNVDIGEPPPGATADNYQRADLRESWPWGDSTVEEILANDVLEHLPMIHALNEAWRVLKPGGVLDLKVPPAHTLEDKVNLGYFSDPTHCWPPWTRDTRYYFCARWNNPQGERGRLGPAYGIKAVFNDLEWGISEYGHGLERRAKLFAKLEAVK